mmetsp:Transcript_8038/g.16173  ORF Transcript_8038/g.16173 Transcript_8038/m.16173 type:complete len:239 (-) Transcript_8038:4863-5579(-)
MGRSHMPSSQRTFDLSRSSDPTISFHDGILAEAELTKRACPKKTSVALLAWPTELSGIIARMCYRVINSQAQAFLNYLFLRPVHQWSMDLKCRASTFNTDFRRQPCHTAERLEELWPTIRIPRIVNRVRADKDVRDCTRFRHGQRETQKQGVPGGYIRVRNLGRHRRRCRLACHPTLRYLQGRPRQKRRRPGPQQILKVDFHSSVVACTNSCGHLLGRSQLMPMPLPIIERHRVAPKA